MEATEVGMGFYALPAQWELLQAGLALTQARYEAAWHGANHESRRRQYALAARARALGWSEVMIVDDDLGRSGGGIERPGFERLLLAICEARVGIADIASVATCMVQYLELASAVPAAEQPNEKPSAIAH
jgi:hypothetical protein